MNKNDIPPGLTEKDELLHSPTSQLKWRESYYFNWVDLDKRISGFSTIGLLPNEKRREFVFLLFLGEKNEVYYREPGLLNYNNNIAEMLKDQRLSYELIVPFKEWRLLYSSRKCKVEIVFKTRFPTYNFGSDSSMSWHQHFETSGIIKGKIKFQDGRTLTLNGYGQRDKSWGFRDWHHFEKWYAGHFQFKDWAASFRKDYHGGNIDLSGHISNEKGNLFLSEVKIDTFLDSDSFCSPISADYEFEDEDGNCYKIRAKKITEKSFIRFAREYPGGFTELFEQMVIMKDLKTGEVGTGMMEHLRTKQIS